MTRHTIISCPSLPIENKNDLQQRLEKKLMKWISFTISIINNKEMITYFKDKNHKSEKDLKQI